MLTNFPYKLLVNASLHGFGSFRRFHRTLHFWMTEKPCTVTLLWKETSLFPFLSQTLMREGERETGHINELCVYNRKPGTELGVRGWKELPRSAWSNKMIISSFVLLPKRELCHVGRMTWAGRTDIWRECVKCNLKFLLWCTPLLSPHTFSKIFLHASFFKIIFGLICFALLWQSRKRGMLYLSEI